MLRTATLALLLASGTALAADDFARLAPPDAALIATVADYTASKSRLLATPLGQLTEAPELAGLFEQIRKDQLEQFEALAAELGVDVEEWPEPAGMVGLATVMATVEGDEMWGPTQVPSFLIVADFGDRIAQIEQILDALVDKGLDQGLIEIESQDVGGVEVLTLTPVPKDEDAPEDEMAAWDEPAQPMNLSALLSGDTPTTVAIAGSVLFLGDAQALVVDAVDRHRGADLPSAADQDFVRQAMAQHADGTADYAIIVPGKLGLTDAFFAGMGLFPGSGFDSSQMLADLGIAGVKAISLGLHLDSPDAQVEFSLGVLDNDRTGLVSLLDVSDQAWDPPAFTSPDAAAASRLLVDFARLPEVVREFWGTLPGDLQAEQGMAFEQVMGFVDQIAPLLGPEVYIVQTISRPFSAQSGGIVVAVPVSDDLVINNLLVLGSQAGLQSRDFAGATVYDLPLGVLPISLSISVAYGHVFVGATPNVEGALRLTAGADQDLSDDPAFQEAMHPLPTTGNAVQFTRALDIAEYSLWAAQNMRQLQVEQMRAMGYPEDFIRELTDTPDDTPEWVKSLTVQALARGVGDVSMEIAPADDGFRGRILLHAPRP